MCWSTHISQRRNQRQHKLSSKSPNHPHYASLEYIANPYRLINLEGDWHEFESKALRRENERKDKEARRAVRQEEHEREKAKRRASGLAEADRDPKRVRPSSSSGPVEVK